MANGQTTSKTAHPQQERPQRYSEEEVRAIVRATVEETFLRLGVAVDDPIEMQRDFSHLREWRVATESMKTKGLLTLTALLVTGGLAALWVGIRDYIVR